MALPDDPAAGSPGGEIAEAADHVIARPSSLNTAKVEIPLGGNLTVKIGDSNVKLSIHYDGLNNMRISTYDTDRLYPLTIQRPGGLDVILSTRHYGDKFDFFGLPPELRNTIYSYVFEDAPEHAGEVFRNKRWLKPTQFLARLNKTATGGSALPFLNRQTLTETFDMLLHHRKFILPGAKQAAALFKSLGPDGRARFSGSLVFMHTRWEDANSSHLWSSMLSECRNLRGIFIVKSSPNECLCDLLSAIGCGEAKLLGLEHLTFSPSIDEEVRRDFLGFLAGKLDFHKKYDARLHLFKRVCWTMRNAQPG